ncbi:hypothetical protein BX600DRAFT_441494 [Xylariales sp. PMI_506]|nr:hypothetical protein BX600DRAFT_441494 [Xylariales sp. PMI_506]
MSQNVAGHVTGSHVGPEALKVIENFIKTRGPGESKTSLPLTVMLIFPDFDHTYLFHEARIDFAGAMTGSGSHGGVPVPHFQSGRFDQEDSLTGVDASGATGAADITIAVDDETLIKILQSWSLKKKKFSGEDKLVLAIKEAWKQKDHAGKKSIFSMTSSVSAPVKGVSWDKKWADAKISMAPRWSPNQHA